MFRSGTATQAFGGSTGNRLGALAAVCILVGLGCTDDISEPPSVPPVSRSVAALQGEELSTLQREWSAYAEKAPGFAGMFLAEDGRLVVLTVDMSEAETLTQAVQPVVQQYQNLSDATTVRFAGTSVQPADYSFAQLVKWHNAIRRNLGGTAEFTSIYIDYKENKVGVGLAPKHEANARAASHAVVRDNGVPEDAVFFYPSTVEIDVAYGPPPVPGPNVTGSGNPTRWRAEGFRRRSWVHDDIERTVARQCRPESKDVVD